MDRSQLHRPDLNLLLAFDVLISERNVAKATPGHFQPPSTQLDPQRVCPLRARSAGQGREITVTPGQPRVPDKVVFRFPRPFPAPSW
jgi:hypothetical protein